MPNLSMEYESGKFFIFLSTALSSESKDHFVLLLFCSRYARLVLFGPHFDSEAGKRDPVYVEAEKETFVRVI